MNGVFKFRGDGFLILYFYFALGGVALAYLLYLFVPKAKSWHLLGVATKVKKILQANLKLQKNHTQKISDALGNIEALFTRSGGTDYVKLLDVLQKLKLSNNELCAVIDLLLEKIETDYPYCLLSNDKIKAFENASSHISDSNKDEALFALKLIYEQFVLTEDNYRRKGRREFWIGTIIGIVGLVLATIPFFI